MTSTNTPTPTYTPTGPPPTPTNTPTNTPTQTSCNCVYFDVTIVPTDLFLATGNTGPNAIYNNKIMINWANCNSVVSQLTYNAAGTYANSICVGSPYTPFVYFSYWKDNFETNYVLNEFVNYIKSLEYDA
jgi:hypothetical protein